MADNQATKNLAERPKLPVWRTVKLSFAFVFSNIPSFFRVVLMPAVLWIATDILIEKFLPGLIGDSLDIVIGAILSSIVYVAWVRFHYLGKAEIQRTFAIKFERREFKLFTYLLIEGLFIFIYLFLYDHCRLDGLLDGTDFLLGFSLVLFSIVVFIFAYLFVLCRFFLIIPFTSLDTKIGWLNGLKKSWSELSGNFWRLHLILFLICIIFLGVVSGFYFIDGLLFKYFAKSFIVMHDVNEIILSVMFFEIPLVIMVATAMSEVFRRLSAIPEKNEQ